MHRAMSDLSRDLHREPSNTSAGMENDCLSTRPSALENALSPRKGDAAMSVTKAIISKETVLFLVLASDLHASSLAEIPIGGMRSYRMLLFDGRILT